jgi:hypothetical protein
VLRGERLQPHGQQCTLAVRLMPRSELCGGHWVELGFVKPAGPAAQWLLRASAKVAVAVAVPCVHPQSFERELLAGLAASPRSPSTAHLHSRVCSRTISRAIGVRATSSNAVAKHAVSQ